MKRIITAMILSVIFIILSKNNINASIKKDLPYEINEIVINKRQNTIVVNGWAFITNAQNFRSASTHKYSLFMDAKDHSLVSIGKINNISHTDTMFYSGSRWCGNREFNVDATICNHMYENIGFSFSIPLDDFKMDKHYVLSLKVDALQANISKTIPLYFPVKQNLILENGQNHYIVDSKLNDISLKVLFDIQKVH